MTKQIESTDSNADSDSVATEVKSLLVDMTKQIESTDCQIQQIEVTPGQKVTKGSNIKKYPTKLTAVKSWGFEWLGFDTNEKGDTAVLKSVVQCLQASLQRSQISKA